MMIEQTNDKSNSHSPINGLIVGIIVAGITLVVGVLRVKRAGISLASQSAVFGAPSAAATPVIHHIDRLSILLKKYIQIGWNHCRGAFLKKFWGIKVPRRLWNFYIDTFLVPKYRTEWGKYKDWSFRTPSRSKLNIPSSKPKNKERRSSLSPSLDEDAVNYPKPLPHNHAGCRRVRINVGGCIYETQARTLNRFPHTMLGDPTKRIRFYDPNKQEYFFDRNRDSFEAILHYFQSGGRFKRPEGLSADILLDDAKFCGLPQSVIYQYLCDEGLSQALELDDILPEDLFVRKIWLLFEYPQSSIQAIMRLSFKTCVY